ncbi:cyclase family protein [Fluviispira multicolorata]|uniref:Kynurenine formamidase n=1 Tax=Fluviispira multicolorata TaxID=2654512 RepID=A0A833JB41_9BACT|nr:cyclase family protein [Fluviispira multicolorata]KAB8028038.1 hypothetical protein GCL57_13375 [Fluviispira multicolorata]
MSYIYLSHTITPQTLGFGGKKAFTSELISSICCGKSNNSSHWKFDNHIGTHIDTPYHFFNEGKSIDKYSPEFWIFSNPFLIIRENTFKDEIIEAGNWLNEIPQNCDLLLLKTGFEKFRNSDIYYLNNPAISPEIANWIKVNRKKVRAIGFDIISLTGFNYRELGRIAHKNFLITSEHEESILIIEDMRLEHLNIHPKNVFVVPMIVKGADGSPVTVLAQL